MSKASGVCHVRATRIYGISRERQQKGDGSKNEMQAARSLDHLPSVHNSSKNQIGSVVGRIHSNVFIDLPCRPRSLELQILESNHAFCSHPQQSELFLCKLHACRQDQLVLIVRGFATRVLLLLSILLYGFEQGNHGSIQSHHSSEHGDVDAKSNSMVWYGIEYAGLEYLSLQYRSDENVQE